MGAHRTKRAPGRVRGASSRCVWAWAGTWYTVPNEPAAISSSSVKISSTSSLSRRSFKSSGIGIVEGLCGEWGCSHGHTHTHTCTQRAAAGAMRPPRSQELRRLSRSSSPPRVRCNQREELRTHTHAPTRNRATTTAAVAAAVAVARAGERQTTSATRRQAGLSAYSASASGSAAPRRCSTSRRRRSLFAALLLLCALLSRCALDFAVFPF